MSDISEVPFKTRNKRGSPVAGQPSASTEVEVSPASPPDTTHHAANLVSPTSLQPDGDSVPVAAGAPASPAPSSPPIPSVTDATLLPSGRRSPSVASIPAALRSHTLSFSSRVSRSICASPMARGALHVPATSASRSPHRSLDSAARTHLAPRSSSSLRLSGLRSTPSAPLTAPRLIPPHAGTATASSISLSQSALSPSGPSARAPFTATRRRAANSLAPDGTTTAPWRRPRRTMSASFGGGIRPLVRPRTPAAAGGGHEGVEGNGGEARSATAWRASARGASLGALSASQLPATAIAPSGRYGVGTPIGLGSGGLSRGLLGRSGGSGLGASIRTRASGTGSPRQVDTPADSPSGASGHSGGRGGGAVGVAGEGTFRLGNGGAVEAARGAGNGGGGGSGGPLLDGIPAPLSDDYPFAPSPSVGVGGNLAPPPSAGGVGGGLGVSSFGAQSAVGGLASVVGSSVGGGLSLAARRRAVGPIGNLSFPELGPVAVSEGNPSDFRGSAGELPLSATGALPGARGYAPTALSAAAAADATVYAAAAEAEAAAAEDAAAAAEDGGEFDYFRDFGPLPFLAASDALGGLRPYLLDVAASNAAAEDARQELESGEDERTAGDDADVSRSLDFDTPPRKGDDDEDDAAPDGPHRHHHRTRGRSARATLAPPPRSSSSGVPSRHSVARVLGVLIEDADLLRESLRQAVHFGQSMIASVDAAESAIAEKTEELEVALADAARAERESQELRYDNEDLRRDLALTRAQVNALEAEQSQLVAALEVSTASGRKGGATEEAANARTTMSKAVEARDYKIAELNSTVAALSREVEQLQQQLADAQADQRKVGTELSAAKVYAEQFETANASVAELTSELSAAKARGEQLAAEAAAAKDDHAAAMAAVVHRADTAEKRLAEQVEAVEALRNELEAERNALRAAEREVATREQELTAARDASAEDRDRISQLNEELSRLKGELSRERQSLQSLTDGLQKASAEESRTQELLTHLEASIAAERREHEVTRKLADDRAAQLAALQKQMASVKEASKGVETELASTKKQLVSSEALAERLRKEKEGLQSDFEAATAAAAAAAAAAESERKKAQEDAAAAAAQLTERDRLISVAESSIRRLGADLSAEKEGAITLATACEKAEKEASTSAARVGELKKQLAAVELRLRQRDEQFSAKEEACASLEAVVEGLRDELEEGRGSASEMEEKMTTLTRQLVALEKQLETARREATAAEERVSAAAAATTSSAAEAAAREEALQHSLHESLAKVEDLEASIARLESSLAEEQGSSTKLAEQLKVLEEAAGETSATLQRQQKELEENQSTIASLRGDLDALNASKETLEVALSEREKQRDELYEQRQAVEQRLSAAEEELERRDRSAEGTSEELNVLSTKLSDEKARVKQLEDALKTAEEGAARSAQSAQETASALEECQHTLKRTEDAKADVVEQLNAMTVNLKSATDKLGELEGRLIAAEERADAAEAAAEEAKVDANSAAEALRFAEEAAAAAAVAEKASAERADGAEARAARAEADAVEARSRAATLEATATTTANEKTQVLTKMRDVEASRAALEKELEAARAASAAAAERRRVLESEVATAQTRAEAAADDAAAAAARLVAMEGEVDSLRAQVDALTSQGHDANAALTAARVALQASNTDLRERAARAALETSHSVGLYVIASTAVGRMQRLLVTQSAASEDILRSVRDNAVAEKEVLEAQLVDLANDLDQSNEARSVALEECEALRQQLSQLKEAVAVAEQQQEASRLALQVSTDRVQQLEGEFKSLHDSAALMQEQKISTTASIGDLQSRLTAANSTIRSLHSAVREAHRLRVRDRQKADSAFTAAMLWQSSADALEGVIESLDAKVGRLEQTLEHQAELAAATESVASTQTLRLDKLATALEGVDSIVVAVGKAVGEGVDTTRSAIEDSVSVMNEASGAFVKLRGSASHWARAARDTSQAADIVDSMELIAREDVRWTERSMRELVMRWSRHAAVMLGQLADAEASAARSAAAHRAAINDLTSSHSTELEDAISSAERAADALRERHAAELRKALEAADGEASRLRAEHQSALEEVRSGVQLERSRASSAAAEEMTSLRDELASVQEERDAAVARANALQSTTRKTSERLEADIVSLQEEVTHLQARNADLSSRLQRARADATEAHRAAVSHDIEASEKSERAHLNASAVGTLFELALHAHASAAGVFADALARSRAAEQSTALKAAEAARALEKEEAAAEALRHELAAAVGTSTEAFAKAAEAEKTAMERTRAAEEQRAAAEADARAASAALSVMRKLASRWRSQSEAAEAERVAAELKRNEAVERASAAVDLQHEAARKRDAATAECEGLIRQAVSLQRSLDEARFQAEEAHRDAARKLTRSEEAAAEREAALRSQLAAAYHEADIRVAKTAAAAEARAEAELSERDRAAGEQSSALGAQLAAAERMIARLEAQLSDVEATQCMNRLEAYEATSRGVVVNAESIERTHFLLDVLQAVSCTAQRANTFASELAQVRTLLADETSAHSSASSAAEELGRQLTAARNAEADMHVKYAALQQRTSNELDELNVRVKHASEERDALQARVTRLETECKIATQSADEFSTATQVQRASQARAAAEEDERGARHVLLVGEVDARTRILTRTLSTWRGMITDLNSEVVMLRTRCADMVEKVATARSGSDAAVVTAEVAKQAAEEAAIRCEEVTRTSEAECAALRDAVRRTAAVADEALVSSAEAEGRGTIILSEQSGWRVIANGHTARLLWWGKAAQLRASAAVERSEASALKAEEVGAQLAEAHDLCDAHAKENAILGEKLVLLEQRLANEMEQFEGKHSESTSVLNRAREDLRQCRGDKEALEAEVLRLEREQDSLRMAVEAAAADSTDLEAALRSAHRDSTIFEESGSRSSMMVAEGDLRLLTLFRWHAQYAAIAQRDHERSMRSAEESRRELAREVSELRAAHDMTRGDVDVTQRLVVQLREENARLAAAVEAAEERAAREITASRSAVSAAEGEVERLENVKVVLTRSAKEAAARAQRALDLAVSEAAATQATAVEVARTATSAELMVKHAEELEAAELAARTSISQASVALEESRRTVKDLQGVVAELTREVSVRDELVDREQLERAAATARALLLERELMGRVGACSALFTESVAAASMELRRKMEVAEVAAKATAEELSDAQVRSAEATRDAQARHRTLVAQLTAAEGKVAAAESTIASLTVQLEAANSRTAQVTENLVPELEEQVRGHEAEVGAVTAQLATTEAQLEVLRAELERLRSVDLASVARAEEARTDARKAASEARTLQAELKASREQTARTEARAVRLEDRVQSVNEELRMAELEALDLRHAVEKAEASAVAAQEGALRDTEAANAAVTSARSAASNASDRATTAERKLSEVSGRLSVEMAAAAAARQAAAHEQARADAAERRAVDLAAEVDELERKVREGEAEMTVAAAEIVHLKAAAEYAANEAAGARDAQRAAKSEVASLTVQLQSLTHQLSASKQLVAALEETRKNQKADLERMEADSASLSAHTAAAEAAAVAFSDAVRSADANVASEKARVARLQAQMACATEVQEATFLHVRGLAAQVNSGMENMADALSALMSRASALESRVEVLASSVGSVTALADGQAASHDALRKAATAAAASSQSAAERSEQIAKVCADVSARGVAAVDRASARISKWEAGDVEKLAEAVARAEQAEARAATLDGLLSGLDAAGVIEELQGAVTELKECASKVKRDAAEMGGVFTSHPQVGVGASEGGALDRAAPQDSACRAADAAVRGAVAAETLVQRIAHPLSRLSNAVATVVAADPRCAGATATLLLDAVNACREGMAGCEGAIAASASAAQSAARAAGTHASSTFAKLREERDAAIRAAQAARHEAACAKADAIEATVEASARVEVAAAAQRAAASECVRAESAADGYRRMVAVVTAAAAQEAAKLAAQVHALSVGVDTSVTRSERVAAQYEAQLETLSSDVKLVASAAAATACASRDELSSRPVVPLTAASMLRSEFTPSPSPNLSSLSPSRARTAFDSPSPPLPSRRSPRPQGREAAAHGHLSIPLQDASNSTNRREAGAVRSASGGPGMQSAAAAALVQLRRGRVKGAVARHVVDVPTTLRPPRRGEGLASPTTVTATRPGTGSAVGPPPPASPIRERVSAFPQSLQSPPPRTHSPLSRSQRSHVHSPLYSPPRVPHGGPPEGPLATLESLLHTTLTEAIAAEAALGDVDRVVGDLVVGAEGRTRTVEALTHVACEISTLLDSSRVARLQASSAAAKACQDAMQDRRIALKTAEVACRLDQGRGRALIEAAEEREWGGVVLNGVGGVAVLRRLEVGRLASCVANVEDALVEAVLDSEALCRAHVEISCEGELATLRRVCLDGAATLGAIGSSDALTMCAVAAKDSRSRVVDGFNEGAFSIACDAARNLEGLVVAFTRRETEASVAIETLRGELYEVKQTNEDLLQEIDDLKFAEQETYEKFVAVQSEVAHLEAIVQAERAAQMVRGEDDEGRLKALVGEVEGLRAVSLSQRQSNREVGWLLECQSADAVATCSALNRMFALLFAQCEADEKRERALMLSLYEQHTRNFRFRHSIELQQFQLGETSRAGSRQPVAAPGVGATYDGLYTTQSTTAAATPQQMVLAAHSHHCPEAAGGCHSLGGSHVHSSVPCDVGIITVHGPSRSPSRAVASVTRSSPSPRGGTVEAIIVPEQLQTLTPGSVHRSTARVRVDGRHASPILTPAPSVRGDGRPLSSFSTSPPHNLSTSRRSVSLPPHVRGTMATSVPSRFSDGGVVGRSSPFSHAVEGVNITQRSVSFGSPLQEVFPRTPTPSPATALPHRSASVGAVYHSHPHPPHAILAPPLSSPPPTPLILPTSLSGPPPHRSPAVAAALQRHAPDFRTVARAAVMAAETHPSSKANVRPTPPVVSPSTANVAAARPPAQDNDDVVLSDVPHRATAEVLPSPSQEDAFLADEPPASASSNFSSLPTHQAGRSGGHPFYSPAATPNGQPDVIIFESDDSRYRR